MSPIFIFSPCTIEGDDEVLSIEIILDETILVRALILRTRHIDISKK
jgi:hypothetical protein